MYEFHWKQFIFECQYHMLVNNGAQTPHGGYICIRNNLYRRKCKNRAIMYYTVIGKVSQLRYRCRLKSNTEINCYYDNDSKINYQSTIKFHEFYTPTWGLPLV